MEDLSSPVKEPEIWNDAKIDLEAKNILRDRRFGQIIPSDTVAHLEFFYNTLILGHQTDNPFKNPDNYPALHYQQSNESPDTLLEIHRKIIFPGEPTPDYNNDDSELQSVSSLGKKYDWYPNRLIESPLSVFTQSPSPKKINP